MEHRPDARGQSLAVKLHFPQSDCDLLHGILGNRSLFLKGVDPHVRRGAAEKGRYDDKFKWRDSLIAITVDMWKEKNYPIARGTESAGKAPFTILELIHEALKRVRPKDDIVPNVSRLKKIYYKTRS